MQIMLGIAIFLCGSTIGFLVHKVLVERVMNEKLRMYLNELAKQHEVK